MLIVDWDAHHGNGTQAMFWEGPDVFTSRFTSSPSIPGQALSGDRGGSREGSDGQRAYPAGTAGDTYRRAFDEVVVPLAERLRPDWLLVSAGFDAHRDDPLTDLGLTAGEFVDLTVEALRLVPHGRLIAFLEGGYDLASLAACVGACVTALGGGDYRPEPVSSGEITGRARAVVETAGRYHRAALAG